MAKIRLSDIVDLIELNSDVGRAVLNLQSGRAEFISDEVMSYVENNENNAPEWMADDVQFAKCYLKNPDDFIDLPSQYDANEFGMIEEFIFNLENEKQKEQLLITIRGKGTFRRFKDTLSRLEIEESWFKFRDEQYKNFAKEWCETHEVIIE